MADIRVKILVFQHDGTVVSQYLLGEGVHVIGRDPNSAIYAESAYISNEHAKLHLTAEGIFIEDLNSNSPNIDIKINPHMSTHTGDWTSTKGDSPTKFVRTVQGARTGNAAILDKMYSTSYDSVAGFEEDPSLVSLGTYTDVNNNSGKNTGNIPGKLDRIFKSIQSAHKIGLTTRINLIIGFPEETFIDCLKTILLGVYYVGRFGVSDVNLGIFNAYPG